MKTCRKCGINVPGRNLCVACKQDSDKKGALKRVKSEKRKSYKYKEWARLVKEKDNYECKHCGLKEIGSLQSHHIIPWEDSIKLRFEISNGLTLCRVCHTKEDRRIKPAVAWNKGRKLSEKHKKKLSDAKIGYIPWNKGIKTKGIIPANSPWLGKKLSEQHKENMRKSGNKGKTWVIDPKTGKRKWILKE